MRLHKCFKQALNMVLHSRLRSWLTIIGIVIGVASVIAIVSIGNGLEEEINSQLGELQADIITITPGYSRAMFQGPGHGMEVSSSNNDAELTNKDVQVLKGISNIDVINTQISGSCDIYFVGEEGSATVTGVDQKNYKDITTTDLLEGRMLDSADSNVVVIGNRLATQYFEKEIGINQMLTIEGRSFRVVGILDDNSNTILMPINSAYDVLDDSEKFVYDTIVVKIKNVDILNTTEVQINTELMRKRHVDEDDKDFTVRTNSASNDMREEMTSTITSFLTAIASVSLFVGAVGVANTMFTSVLEKTKEIGIMKAIGARNKDIMIIFLFNAALIGFVGGILGVIFGALTIWVLSLLGMPSAMHTSTVLGTVALSVGIGMISGLIPSYQASNLKPVDALRTD